MTVLRQAVDHLTVVNNLVEAIDGSRKPEQRRLDRGLASLEPVLPGSRLELCGGWNRPPMEVCPESMAVFERARAIGADLGLNPWALPA